MFRKVDYESRQFSVLFIIRTQQISNTVETVLIHCDILRPDHGLYSVHLGHAGEPDYVPAEAGQCLPLGYSSAEMLLCWVAYISLIEIDEMQNIIALMLRLEREACPCRNHPFLAPRQC